MAARSGRVGVEFTAPTGLSRASRGRCPAGVSHDRHDQCQPDIFERHGADPGLTGIAATFSSPRFSRPGGGSSGRTCLPELRYAGSCTINVVFSPNAAGAVNSTLTVTANVPLTGSPVALERDG